MIQVMPTIFSRCSFLEAPFTREARAEGIVYVPRDAPAAKLRWPGEHAKGDHGRFAERDGLRARCNGSG